MYNHSCCIESAQALEYITEELRCVDTVVIHGMLLKGPYFNRPFVNRGFPSNGNLNRGQFCIASGQERPGLERLTTYWCKVYEEKPFVHESANLTSAPYSQPE